MPTQVWPTSLPQNPFTGYGESAEPNVVSTEVGSGPPKTRQRSTKERCFQTTAMEVTQAQKLTFETFWAAISHGALPVEWQDMVTGDTVEFKFLKKPTFINLNPGAAVADRWYSCTLELERL